MTIYIADIEADGLEPTKIHCISIKDYVTKERWRFTDMADFEDWWFPQDHLSIVWVFHNGLNYDVPNINKLTNVIIPEDKVIDTMVVSKLRNYKRYQTHSLDEIGTSLGHPKTEYTGGWEVYTDVMGDYCDDDVDVTEVIFTDQYQFIHDLQNRDALRVEHDIATLCYEMGQNGFPFDRAAAEQMLAGVKAEMAVIEDMFQKVIPPKRVEDRRIQYRIKKDGTLYANVIKTLAEEPDVVREGDELVVYKQVPFSPASGKQCIDLLWTYGWKPTDKTKGHIKYERELQRSYYKEVDKKRLDSFKTYGWKLNEENLKTLPKSAPQEIQALTQWLTLDGRRSTYEEWIAAWDHRDERIHPKLWHIGAWTHRMSHSNPNSANISRPFYDEKGPQNPVEFIKDRYDARARELWHAPEGAWLVGTDADSIQLRILAHYMKSEEYRDAIVSGSKKDETDIHNLNRKALGPVCRDRDMAKTFIYAYVLGAGIGQVANILHTNTNKAKEAMDNFYKALPALKKVKDYQAKKDAARGGFRGLDGRWVQCNSSHLMLAGYLQNGEAIIMKRAMVKWYRWAKEAGLNFEPVNFVHDEWQTIVYGSKEDAERLGALQRKALEEVGDELDLFCPLAGETKIGKNWKETH